MRLLLLLCIAALISISACSEEILYFADDHYKAIAGPKLSASVSSPVIEAGKTSTIRISLANGGKLEELIPTNVFPGAEEAASMEMSEEMKSCDAYNITAKLSSEYPITVISGPCHLGSLLAGSVATMNFSVYASGGAVGDCDLPLEINFERQTDVSILDGIVSPLYQPVNFSQRVMVSVVDDNVREFSIMGIEHDLSPGSRGTLKLLIKGPGSLSENCTARLLARPPFHASGDLSMLGTLSPGEVAIASFEVEVDGDASAKEYQLGCEISADGRTSIIAVPAVLGEKPSVIRTIAFAATAISIALLGLQILRLSIKRRQRHKPLR
jgi:hypothetical protein